MDVRSAELTKYAANAMLATRISFMNELANLAETLGADIEDVRRGIGSDPRIGYHFLYPGAGYGGSCFPKDVQALLRTARPRPGMQLRVLDAVEQANERAEARARRQDQGSASASDLKGKRIRALGPRVQAQYRRHARGAEPGPDRRPARGRRAASAPTIRWRWTEARQVSGGSRVACADSPMDALEGADALAIVTEWKEFRSPDFERMKQALQDAGDLRRPQPVRSGRWCSDARLRVLPIGRRRQ